MYQKYNLLESEKLRSYKLLLEIWSLQSHKISSIQQGKPSYLSILSNSCSDQEKFQAGRERVMNLTLAMTRCGKLVGLANTGSATASMGWEMPQSRDILFHNLSFYTTLSEVWRGVASYYICWVPFLTFTCLLAMYYQCWLLMVSCLADRL